MKNVTIKGKNLLAYKVDEKHFIEFLCTSEELGQIDGISKELNSYQAKNVYSYVQDHLSDKLSCAILELIQEANLFLSHTNSDDISQEDCVKEMLGEESITAEEINKITLIGFENICSRLQSQGVEQKQLKIAGICNKLKIKSF